MAKIISLGLVLVLSIVGVCGDYFLKRAGEAGSKSGYIFLGVALFAVSALGWFVVYRHIKISSAGFLYGISTAVLLVLMGTIIFKEKINSIEMAGMALAAISFVLLARFA